jgi:hypothetical protein
MIRPFDLRDVSLVAQLENQGTPLYSELALTRGTRPLQSALTGFFSLHNRGDYTFVSPDSPGGFAQMRRRATAPRAIVTFIAPGLAAGNEVADVWTQLLESLATAAGELTLQQLVAEVPEEGPEITVLHRAGFAIMLRQDILRFKADSAVEPPSDTSLRPCVETDAWGIQQLYLNTAPRLAQQAEVLPRPHRSGATRSYVLEENGEVMAYLEIRRGASGAWLNTVVHPQAEQHARDVIALGLARLGRRWSAPVYCCVRRYQDWLGHPLQSLGFEAFSSTAVMVKRLVVPVVEPERAPSAASVLVHSKVTTPVVHSQDSHSS